MRRVYRRDSNSLDSSRPVMAFEIVEGKPSYPPHGHEFAEVAFITTGTGYHILDGIRTELRAGDCFVVARGRTHSFENLKGFGCINLLFLEELLLERVPELVCVRGYRSLLHWEPALRETSVPAGAVRPSPDRFAFIVSLLRTLEVGRQPSILEPIPDTAKSIADLSALTLILVELCRAYGERADAAARRFLPLEAALSWFDAHAGERVGVREMARATGLSVSSLERRFREALGCCPAAYLRAERLRRAAVLLEDRALPVAEIARRTGFTDTAHLSRSFKQRFGVSPREWRLPR